MKAWRLYRRRRTRSYEAGAKHRWLRHAAAALLAAVLIFSSFRVGEYAGDYFAARRSAQQVHDAYYADPTAAPTDAPAITAAPTPSAAPAASAAPSAMLPAVKYPDNPYALISERFRRIRRQNQDIVGWLTIENVIDQAVVQRDNTYYLDRDYQGFHNVNGSIFLDEDCRLNTRPYTFTLYGHNMKTGAMFGVLRNYENLTFYQHNPFVSFDTAYEEGRYVIFSVATVSTGEFSKEYLDFGKLNAATRAWREEAITTLKEQSLFTAIIDVQPEDQLLLLVTCVEDDEERRIVAARRLREGEKESDLAERVQRIRKKQY